MFQVKFVVTLLLVLWLQALAGLGAQAQDSLQHRDGRAEPVLSLASSAPTQGLAQPSGLTAELGSDLFEVMATGPAPVPLCCPAGARRDARWRLAQSPWLDVPHRPPRPTFG